MTDRCFDKVDVADSAATRSLQGLDGFLASVNEVGTQCAGEFVAGKLVNYKFVVRLNQSKSY